MKCLAVLGEGRLALKEKTVPRKLEPDQVLLEVAFCYIDERVEECSLGPERSTWPVEGLAPYFIGWEVAGKVVSTGDKVTRCRVGDSVLAFCPDGACAKQAITHESCVVVKPVKLDSSVALSAFKPGILAYAAVFSMLRVEAGDTVLLLEPTHPVCWIGLQILSSIGAAPTVLVRSESEREKFLTSFNAQSCTILVLPQWEATDVSAWQTKVDELLVTETDGLGFDCIIDPTFRGITRPSSLGEEHDTVLTALRKCLLASLAEHGRIVTRDCSFELCPQELMALTLRGGSLSFLSEYPWMLSSAKRYRFIHVLENILQKMDAATLEPLPLEQIPHDQAPALLETILFGDSPQPGFPPKDRLVKLL